MMRLSRLAQMRAVVSRPTVALKQPALKQPTFAPSPRFYSVPPKTHFQKGDIPPERDTSSSASSGPKSYFQGSGSDIPPPPSGAAGRIIVNEPGSKIRFRTIVLLLALISGATAWWFYPRHTFSPEVAALLRKALKAESDSFGGQNLPEAVKYYIEALMEAEIQGLSPLTDEYTGMQLKLAEMYEMLNHPEAANDVYREICGAYVAAIQHDKVTEKARPHFIQRGLRIALKLAHNATGTSEKDVNDVLWPLWMMVMLAQENVSQRCPPAADLVNLASMAPASEGERQWMLQLTKAAAQARQLRVTGEFDAWMPFRDELIAARDIITTLHLSLNETNRALREKQATYQIMLASGCGVGDLLLAQANLASMYYFLSENFEVVEKDVGNNKNRAVIKSTTGEPVTLDAIKSSSAKALARSESIYQRVLKAIPSLEPEVRRTKEVEEAQALCTYGVGVVAVKRGELDKARDMIREARTRAKGSGFDDLVDAADGELAKVDKLALEAELKGSDNKESSKESTESPKTPTVAEIHDAIANEIPEGEEEKK